MLIYLVLIACLMLNGLYSANETLICAAGLFAIAGEIAAHYKKMWMEG